MMPCCGGSTTWSGSHHNGGTRKGRGTRMKYKDYYAILGVKRDATADEIKTAYRKLARKYHPDVSKEKDAEEKFKEMSEAYETLKDPEKRAAYDQLGSHTPGQEFRPPPDWGSSSRKGKGLRGHRPASLFAGLAGRAGPPAARSRRTPDGRQRLRGRRAPLVRAGVPRHGGRSRAAALEWDPDGGVRRVPHRVKTRIPRGVTNGEKLRVPGKGGKGVNGGPDGDLYLDIEVAEHPLYRVSGKDLYVDLPLAPWEAVLGTSVKLPTPAGAVTLKVPAGTRAGQELRLTGRGMSARQRPRRPPVRGGAHRSADGRRRQAEGALQGARRDLELRSACATRAGGAK